ncbi:hypothetical protein [Flammeovirga kamogawensis]|uniref:Uncharacterized protein n=1 Tax=Flammeovirga kamogawensis TaxID=373891 RepID=A0ABX8H436_9BACT|nr:hypothetical protein [Flammeovirga kamogawensis]MBB6461747.1 hypothetical protein [Flammeovirga kamogawensis]QWG10663.1 hypothetical protein KM029_25100 [Flammeovirga kamogawensis]TRX63767.1 hypothetical protein EO216_25480 [Flammeovirga kamogawensis]
MGKINHLSKYLTVESESKEGVDKLLEYVVSNWTSFQDQEVAPNKETSNDLILDFLQKVDAKVDKEAPKVGSDEEEDQGNQVLTSLQKLTDRVNKQYDIVLNPYFKKKSITSDQDREVGIQDVTNLLILTEVLLMHYDLEEVDEDSKIAIKVFLDGKINQKPFGIKNFMAKTVGKFLVLANNNFTVYGDKELDKKFDKYKKQLLSEVLFLVFNVSWLPKERTYKNTLILNLLQCINLGDEVDAYGDVMSKVLSYTQKIKNLNPSIVRECSTFFERTLPQYLDWKKLEIKDRTFKQLGYVEDYNILFAKKLGFFTVDTIQSNGNSDIVRAGYPLVEEHFVWENVPMGDKTKKKVVYQ